MGFFSRKPKPTKETKVRPQAVAWCNEAFGSWRIRIFVFDDFRPRFDNFGPKEIVGHF